MVFPQDRSGSEEARHAMLYAQDVVIKKQTANVKRQNLPWYNGGRCARYALINDDRCVHVPPPAQHDSAHRLPLFVHCFHHANKLPSRENGAPRVVESPPKYWSMMKMKAREQHRGYRQYTPEDLRTATTTDTIAPVQRPFTPRHGSVGWGSRVYQIVGEGMLWEVLLQMRLKKFRKMPNHETKHEVRLLVNIARQNAVHAASCWDVCFGQCEGSCAVLSVKIAAWG